MIYYCTSRFAYSSEVERFYLNHSSSLLVFQPLSGSLAGNDFNMMYVLCFDCSRLFYIHCVAAVSPVQLSCSAMRHCKIDQQTFIETRTNPSLINALNNGSYSVCWRSLVEHFSSLLYLWLQLSWLFLLSAWRSSSCHIWLLLWISGAPGSGKTAIAAHMAKQSDFPFLKICAPKNMIGYHEAAKVQAIKKVSSWTFDNELVIGLLLAHLMKVWWRNM